MPQERDTPLLQPGDFALALALLTRLPVPLSHAAATRGAAAAWAWPLAGALVGGLAALAGSIALALGLPTGVAAGIVLAMGIVLTGALHEDGLADCADGFWGGWDRARRLEIMKDSHIGSYGVLALGLSLILRWSALSALIAAGHLWGPVIAAAALSRAPMAGVMHALPNARGSGLSQSTGRPAQDTVLLGGAVALAVALLATGGAVLAAVVAVALAGLATAAIARARIGGQTGDVLGATQQLAEIAALAALAAVLV